MPSIRELRDQKQRESFTGRQAELNTFRRLLVADDADYAILYIFGVGGIGKSSLLKQFRRIAREGGHPTAIVDLQVHFSVDEILRSIRDQVGVEDERVFDEFDKALVKFSDVKSKLQGAVGSLASGVVSGLREGVPLGLGALAVDTIGEEQMKAWLYRHLPRDNADLYLHGDQVLTEALVVGLNGLVQQNRCKLAIMFDTYEQCSQAQDSWLRDILLDSNLSNQVLIVIAGRDPPPGRWHEWRSVLLSRSLGPFTEAEAGRYLARRGITDPTLVDALLGFTERLPWALAMAADTPGVHDMTASDFTRASYRYVIGDKLVERFVSQVHDDAEMRELVNVCAVVRTFDHDVVRAVWGRADVEEPMRRLRRFSFVRVRPDGRWSLNQVVRDFLDRGLRRRSLHHWTELNRRAVDFYRESAAIRTPYSAEWNWLTLESLYHHLRLNEDDGIAYFVSLFDDAKRLSRHDFSSELLNNIQDVPLVNAHNQHWLTFYQGVINRVTNTFAWDEAHAINQRLYDAPDLPPALRARVTTDLGRYYYQISNQYEQAIAMLKESLSLRRGLQDEQGQAHVFSHLAVAQAAAGDFEAGRRSGLACVNLARRLNAPYRLGWGYSSLGVVESRAGNYTEAIDYFRQSLEAFEAAGYEFEPGVVHYRMGRVSLSTGDLDGALEHFKTNLQLMLKYDKPVLAARTIVDISEIYLAQLDEERLVAQTAEAERMILEQGNDAQLVRLRLVQAEMTLCSRDRIELDVASIERLADCYLEALLAAARAPRPMLLPTTEKIAQRLSRLLDEGRTALVQAISQAVVVGVTRALEGTLARHGQLVTVSPSALRSLGALNLDQRWAFLAEAVYDKEQRNDKVEPSNSA